MGILSTGVMAMCGKGIKSRVMGGHMNLKVRTIVTILLLLVITGTCAFAQSENGIAGKWESEWGTLTFQHSTIAGNQSLSVTGSWEQGNGKIGEIRNGTFDPSRGIIEFSYYQSWNKVTGSAKFTLSSDGEKLSGTWSQSDGQSGTWNCKRTADNTSSEKIIRVSTCFTFKGGNYIESEKHDYNSGQTKYVIIAWDILSPASMGGSNTYLGNSLYLLTSPADE